MKTLGTMILLMGFLLGCGNAWAQEEESTERDLLRVKEKEEENPRLRITDPTASVMSLAFTADSRRLCTAGLDKAVHVWSLSALGRDLRRTFLRERTIRWQVARGLRGSLYSIAVSPADGLLAMGGYGAMGSTGEILIVNPVTGKLQKALSQHLQAISNLQFSPDGRWLLSTDLSGETTLWTRATWDSANLVPADVENYGEDTAKRIRPQAELRTASFVGSKRLIVPVWDSFTSKGTARWKLQLHQMPFEDEGSKLDTFHYGTVTALAGTKDGKTFASADLAGQCFLWKMGATPKPTPLDTGSVVRSMTFTPDGEKLLIGTAAFGKPAQVQIWDVGTRKKVKSIAVSNHVTACTVSPDGQYFAYTGAKNHGITLASLDGSKPNRELRGKGRPIYNVAFAAEEPFYRIAYGSKFGEQVKFNAYGPLTQSYDPEQLELAPKFDDDPNAWLAHDWAAGDWSARLQSDGTLQLYQGKVAKGVVSFDARIDGRIRCYTFVPDAQGKPIAIAVGLDRRNGVYVLGLSQKGNCPIWRYFRGHSDWVTSVGASKDGRYLVSGSVDQTVRIWSLKDLQEGKNLFGSWGAKTNVVGQELVVNELQEAGPLFYKGVRTGDVITEIRWVSGTEVKSADTPASITRQLAQLPWGTQVAFETNRGRKERPPFQLLAAWPPLATLYARPDREWALWTPSGFYDASANGHRMFGWQINRGLEQLPDHYRADQFRKRLERPDVLRHLMAEGSIPAAFRKALEPPPEEPQEVLIQQIAAAPKVEIQNPDAGTSLARPRARLTATVRVPKKSTLKVVRAYANGVPGTNQIVVQRVPTDDDAEEITYQWDMNLPADNEHLMQVFVETDAPVAAFDEVVVAHPKPQWPKQRPKLYVLAVGVNNYRDPRIQPLNYSEADAKAMVEALQQSATEYEVVSPQLLLDEEVTAENWTRSFRKLSQQLRKQATPNDLLVFFLAGHGFLGGQPKQYYFAPYDLNIENFQKDIYENCISWNDFTALADVPCRKVAFLDTCHSGAIQPLRARNLKSALRTLQEDVIFTLAASAGHEKAAENPAWEHGAFTASILEAFNGAADRSKDQQISLVEVVEYTKNRVAELTNDRQHPTMAPSELIPYANLRLVSVPSEE